MKKFKPDKTETTQRHWTSAYERFEFSPLNRAVCPSHVDKLVASMKEQGFLKRYAIDVLEHQGQFLILAGQHRYSAAKKLGIQVIYTIVDPNEANNAIVLDHLGFFRGWNLENILNYHTNKNLEPYKRLDQFVKSYNFPIEVSLQIVTGLDFATGRPLLKTYKDDFKYGRLKLSKTRLKEAETNGDAITDIINLRDEHEKYSRSSAFIRGLYMLINQKNFSSARLLKALRTSSKGIVVRGPWDETLEGMIDLYNFKKHNKLTIPAVMDKVQKRRKLRATRM